MYFEAIVHAPALRVGARVNIAAADQPEEGKFFDLAVGAEVRVQLGVCCPDHVCGKITQHTGSDPDRAILSVDAQSWTLQKIGTAVTDPGLFSETWFVVALAEGA